MERANIHSTSLFAAFQRFAKARNITGLLFTGGPIATTNGSKRMDHNDVSPKPYPPRMVRLVELSK
jgi:hypothetical protein